MATNVIVKSKSGGSLSATQVDFTLGAVRGAESVLAPVGLWAAIDPSELPKEYGESSTPGYPTIRLYRLDALRRCGLSVEPVAAGVSFQLA